MPVSKSSSNKTCRNHRDDSASSSISATFHRSRSHHTFALPCSLKCLAVSRSPHPPPVPCPSALLHYRVFLSHSTSVTSALLRSASFASPSFLCRFCLFRPPLLPTLVRLEQSSSTNLSQALAELGVLRSAAGMRVNTPISAAFSRYVYIYICIYIYIYIYIF